MEIIWQFNKYQTENNPLAFGILQKKKNNTIYMHKYQPENKNNKQTFVGIGQSVNQSINQSRSQSISQGKRPLQLVKSEPKWP